MAMRRGPRVQRPRPPLGPRINHRIRVRQVRCIDEEGKSLGVMDTADALALAARKGLDLVEIAADQRPPVCRIMDYGKFKYEQKKKDQASRRKQHQVQVKEVRVRPKIAEHDMMVKVRKARKFLEEGHSVRVQIMFRRRELRRPEMGIKLLDRFSEELADVAQVETRSPMEGRFITMVLGPRARSTSNT